MTEVELAKLMRKSNYTCQGINCKECVTVNRYRTCLMEDVQIYCDDILGADDNYVEKLEKENELLAKRITELQANIVKLTDEVTELNGKLKQVCEKCEKAGSKPCAYRSLGNEY